MDWPKGPSEFELAFIQEALDGGPVFRGGGLVRDGVVGQPEIEGRGRHAPAQPVDRVGIAQAGDGGEGKRQEHPAKTVDELETVLRRDKRLFGDLGELVGGVGAAQRRGAGLRLAIHLVSEAEIRLKIVVWVGFEGGAFDQGPIERRAHGHLAGDQACILGAGGIVFDGEVAQDIADSRADGQVVVGFAGLIPVENGDLHALGGDAIGVGDARGVVDGHIPPIFINIIQLNRAGFIGAHLANKHPADCSAG